MSPAYWCPRARRCRTYRLCCLRWQLRRKNSDGRNRDDISAPTGWAEERTAAFTFSQNTPAQFLPVWVWIIPIMVGSWALWPLWAVLWSVVKMFMRDATAVHIHSDRKGLSKERQKKIAQDHRADDHEEQQTISCPHPVPPLPTPDAENYMNNTDCKNKSILREQKGLL
ncbi:Uncharacterised protein [uncultured Clostridium sp.]|uniref:Uncharacterized protein n=2 Tax=Eubacteriales TaxID=186802 RepID=A0A2U1BBZ2_9FIRM|nr:hypothetical protein C7373_12019 [Intestinimonas butyriciproducens]SCJ64144.1 Uncharacterised protein [uncultured Clostridium sp.]